MKYETPELTALTLAINAIQAGGDKGVLINSDGASEKEGLPAYMDWE